MIILVESESSLCARYGILLADQLPWPVTFSIAATRQVMCYSYNDDRQTSPARKIDTPQIFPSKPTPSYVAPFSKNTSI